MATSPVTGRNEDAKMNFSCKIPAWYCCLKCQPFPMCLKLCQGPGILRTLNFLLLSLDQSKWNMTKTGEINRSATLKYPSLSISLCRKWTPFVVQQRFLLFLIHQVTINVHCSAIHMAKNYSIISEKLKTELRVRRSPMVFACEDDARYWTKTLSFHLTESANCV